MATKSSSSEILFVMTDLMENKRSLQDYPSKNFSNHNHIQWSNAEETFLSQTTRTPNDSASCPISSTTMRSSRRRSMRPPFPFKLHEMLDEAEKLPYLKAIVSWQPHGRAFIVHDTKVFIQEANKRSFFKPTKYPSFQRQLNLYGFQRISAGVDKGAYHHKLFLMGQRGLTQRIQRIRIKGTKVRKPASPANEPDFYSLPCLLPRTDHGRANSVGPNPGACPTRPPRKSNCSSPGLTLIHNDTVILPPSGISRVPSCGENSKKDYSGQHDGKRPRQIARLASASPDPTRESELDNCDQSCKLANVNPLSDDVPFLHLQLPTLNCKATKSHGLTFVRAAGNRWSEVSQRTCPQIAVAGKVPLLLDQSFQLAQPPILPLMQCWVSEEDEKYSLLTTLEGGRFPNPRWTSTTLLEQEGNLGLDGLPADTELEEYIAFHVIGIDCN